MFYIFIFHVVVPIVNFDCALELCDLHSHVLPRFDFASVLRSSKPVCRSVNERSGNSNLRLSAQQATVFPSREKTHSDFTISS